MLNERREFFAPHLQNKAIESCLICIPWVCLWSSLGFVLVTCKLAEHDLSLDS